MGLFSKPNPPIGFHHFLGTHSVLCKGPIDYISRIRGEDKTVWEGLCEGGEIFIDAVDAYGGQYDGEGGVLGWLDIEMGAADQQKNRYLQGALGTTKMPAHRGVVSAIQKQMYVGITKYPKPLKYLSTRTDVRDDGESQWYVERARIGAGLSGPVSVYFALDNSGSMQASASNGRTRLENQGAAIKAAIAMLAMDADKYRVDIGICLYGSPPSTSSTIIRRDIDVGAVEEFNDFIDAASGDMETYWPLGLAGAGAFFNESPAGKHVVIFTTDGEPSATGYTSEQIASAAESLANSLTAPVYAVNIDMLDTSWTQRVDTSPRDGVPVVSGGDPSQLLSIIRYALMHADMNPAHILRELDTSRYYGMRHPESDIDDDAFMQAADVLFNESMGMGYLWGFDGTESSVHDFSNIICRHIDAIHAVSFQTGKVKLWLIREDYDPDELPVFDASNVKRVLSAHCTSPHELVNKVTAAYWDPTIGKTRTVCVSNPAAIANGAPVNAASLDLTGFSSSRLAILGAQRELRSLGNQAWTFEIEVTRVGETVDFGSVVKLNLPNHKANNVIMRVMDIGIMDTDDATIKLVLSQDLYSLPEVPVVVQTPDYEDPAAEPSPADPRLVLELPYWELVRREGQASVDAALAVDPGLGFVGVAAGAPGGTTGAEMWIDDGNGYETAGSLPFAVITTLAGDLPRLHGVITVDGELGIFGIEVGMIGSLNDELVACGGINVEADPIEITLMRGVLDTTPADHQAGDEIVWWSDSYSTDEQQYSIGTEVLAKILTRTSTGKLALSAAPADAVTLNARASRPYPPANVKLNGEYWPGEINGNLEITARERNRLTQTEPVGFFYDGDISPESGQTYSYEIYNEATNTLIDSDSGISGFPIEISSSNLATLNRLELFSVRDGFESFFRLIHVFSVPGFPYELHAEYDDVSVSLTWAFDGVSADGFKIYRDTSQMDPDSLPSPLATVDILEREYQDTTVEDGETYYYRVSAYSNDPEFEKVSAELEYEVLASDPHFAYVVGLIHMEGPDDSTAIADVKGNTWIARGGAKLTTEQYRFGTASLALDGADDDIVTASSSAFGFGTGDFTWEAWVRRSNNNCAIFDNRSSGADTSSIVVFISPSGYLSYYDGSNKFGTDAGSGGIIPVGTWTHVAITRQSSAVKMWVSGTQVFSGIKSDNMGSSKPMIVGRDVGGTSDFLGEIDECRWTKFARYSSGFLPPNKRFPDK